MKTIIIDADNTLYSIGDSQKAYDKMFNFLSQKTKKTKDNIREEFKNNLKNIIKSRNIEKRKREYLLGKIVNDKKVVEKALGIFWKEVLLNLRLSSGISHFLKKTSGKYLLIISSDEFISNLKKKLEKSFGKKYTKIFSGIVTPEDTGCLKPDNKFFEMVLKKYNIKKQDIVGIVGDDFERDFSKLRDKKIKKFLFTKENNSDIKKEVDFIFSDFRQLIKYLEKNN